MVFYIMTPKAVDPYQIFFQLKFCNHLWKQALSSVYVSQIDKHLCKFCPQHVQIKKRQQMKLMSQRCIMYEVKFTTKLKYNGYPKIQLLQQIKLQWFVYHYYICYYVGSNNYVYLSSLNENGSTEFISCRNSAGGCL